MTVDSSSVSAVTADALLKSGPVRELILLAGKDGTGKSSAIVSLALYIQSERPGAAFYLIDTENKIKSTLSSFRPDVPGNIRYYKCDSMNQVTAVTAEVMAKHKPGDWLAVESLSRVWERAQDLAYLAVSGCTKIEYLERKTKKSPIPQPDQFWQIAKGAHDGAFFDLLTQSDDLNVILTTTMAKVKDIPGMKESADRRAIRAELGIDANLEGAPRIPYYVETLALMEMKGGAVTCRLLRDNLSQLDDPRAEFDVPDRKSWGAMFHATCRP